MKNLFNGFKVMAQQNGVVVQKIFRADPENNVEKDGLII
jgi:hypothetical protein